MSEVEVWIGVGAMFLLGLGLGHLVEEREKRKARIKHKQWRRDLIRKI